MHMWSCMPALDLDVYVVVTCVCAAGYTNRRSNMHTNSAKSQLINYLLVYIHIHVVMCLCVEKRGSQYDDSFPY